MRKILIIAIAFFMSHASYAQLLDNKARFYVGYMNGGFRGEKTLQEDSFIAPALYANYDNFIELPLKLLFEVKPFLSLGMGFTYASANQWTSQAYTLYNNSGISQYSFSPVIQLHSKSQGEDVLSRFRPFVEIAPAIGWSYVKLNNPLMFGSGAASQPMNSSDMFYGLRTTLGVDVSITNYFGINASYSRQKNLVNSSLYQDTSFSTSNIGVGVYLLLGKEKRMF